MLKRTLLAVIILLLTFSFAGAEMYKWVDEKGVVTFKDAPPPASKKSKKVKTYRDNDFDATPPYQAPATTNKVVSSAPVSTAQPAPPKNVRFTGTVELYVTSWCGYCKKAQKYLTERGVPFVAYDIEKDSAANLRHKQLGGNGVPLIIIGANKMSGFSPEGVDYYLEHSK
jgi:glutaredoxin-like YruB-family protein